MEIKPCVKCGSRPKLYRVGDGKQFFAAKCSKCGYTPVPFNCAEFLAYKALEVWNKYIKQDGGK